MGLDIRNEAGLESQLLKLRERVGKSPVIWGARCLFTIWPHLDGDPPDQKHVASWIRKPVRLKIEHESFQYNADPYMHDRDRKSVV